MVTVFSSDVGADAAALAPPLVTVGGQAGLDVLRHDAPRQIVIAIVAPGVIEEISPGGEDVTGKPRAALRGEPDTSTAVNIRRHKDADCWSSLAHPVQVRMSNPEEENDEGGGEQLPHEQDHAKDDVACVAQSGL